MSAALAAGAGRQEAPVACFACGRAGAARVDLKEEQMSKARLFSVAAAVLALVFATGLSAAAGDLDATFDGDGIVLTDLAGGSNGEANSVAVQTTAKSSSPEK